MVTRPRRHNLTVYLGKQQRNTCGTLALPRYEPLPSVSHVQIAVLTAQHTICFVSTRIFTRIIGLWLQWFQCLGFLSSICVQKHLYTSVQVRYTASHDVTLGRETWTEQTKHSADRANISI